MSEFVYIYVCIIIIHDHFTSLSYQRRAFKGDNIYLHSNLIPAQVAPQRKHAISVQHKKGRKMGCI